MYNIQFKIFFFFILMNTVSCIGQEEIKVTINNFSSHKIDSIVIPEKKEKGLDKLVFNKRIDTSQSEVLKIDLDRSKLWNEGSFWIKIYSKDKIWENSWGFHDMGFIINDTINIYNNGLSTGKQTLKKPKELTVFFFNKDKTGKIDAIVSPSIIKETISRSIVNGVEKEDAETRIIIFDFDKISRMPEFDVWISGNKYKAILKHNFDDWNNNQAFLFFNNGQFSDSSF